MKNKFLATWRLIGAYWVSEDRWFGRGLLALVITLDVLIVARQARVTFWQKDFYDALANHDVAAFKYQLTVLAVIAAVGVVMDTARTYVFQALDIRWRSWMTGVFLQRWLGDHAYYRIERDRATDNADQRIAEDLNLLTTHVLELGLGLLTNIANLVTFSMLVWTLSGTISLVLFERTVDVPGYMLWAALIYAIIGSVVMERIAGRLVNIDYEQQRTEADFRFLLMRVRENAEQIALYRGHDTEQVRLRHTFAAIRNNWRALMTYTKRITAAERFFVEVGGLMPYLLASPRYFSGHITLGGVMQLGQSFMKVRTALSWFVHKYKDLAMLRSVCRRLVEFEAAIERPPQDGIATAATTTAVVRTVGLVLHLPDGQSLNAPLDWQVAPGQRWLLRGPSGVGKSSLLRAIAGLWRHGAGRIERDPALTTLFVPQRSYLPLGSLRACLCYPLDDNAFTTHQCERALDDVGLGALHGHLAADDDWSRRLSPGEQQKLAFARVLLHRPACLFLDEATSSLDMDSEARLYACIIERLPGLTLVSVAHRDSLSHYHSEVLSLQALPLTAGRDEAADHDAGRIDPRAVVAAAHGGHDPLRDIPAWRPA
ncbi:MAG: ABC transporter ATP-binding protein/permease [Rhodocyclaceae bacterium]